MQPPDGCLSVRVEQQLVGIEAVSIPRLVRAMYAITIDSTRPRVGNVAVPDLVRVFRQLDALDLAPSIRTEETQLDLAGMRREDREVDPEPIPGRAQRKRPPFSYPRSQIGLDGRGSTRGFGRHRGRTHFCTDRRAVIGQCTRCSSQPLRLYWCGLIAPLGAITHRAGSDSC